MHFLRDEYGNDQDEDDDAIGYEERDVIQYLQRLEEDNLFEMNLLTEEENNLEKIEKESKDTIELKRKEIHDVDKNIFLLKQTLSKRQEKIDFYDQILTSSSNKIANDKKYMESSASLQNKRHGV